MPLPVQLCAAAAGSRWTPRLVLRHQLLSFFATDRSISSRTLRPRRCSSPARLPGRAHQTHPRRLRPRKTAAPRPKGTSPGFPPDDRHLCTCRGEPEIKVLRPGAAGCKQNRQGSALTTPGIDSGAPKAPLKGCRISLRAVTTTADCAEPQQCAAKERKRGRFWHCRFHIRLGLECDVAGKSKARSGRGGSQ